MWNFLPEHQAGLRGYINSGERLLDLRQVALAPSPQSLLPEQTFRVGVQNRCRQAKPLMGRMPLPDALAVIFAEQLPCRPSPIVVQQRDVDEAALRIDIA